MVVSVAKSYAAAAINADDVAQDVMLKLWTLHDDIANRAHCEALARRMARQISISDSRKRHPVELSQLHINKTASHDSPERTLEEHENTAWLIARMNSLPPIEYQILKLRQAEQLSNGDIAALLGIEKTSVATLLSRARHKLLNEFKRKNKI